MAVSRPSYKYVAQAATQLMMATSLWAPRGLERQMLHSLLRLDLVYVLFVNTPWVSASCNHVIVERRRDQIFGSTGMAQDAL